MLLVFITGDNMLSRNNREGHYYGRLKRETLNDPYFDMLKKKGSRHERVTHKALFLKNRKK